MNNPTYDCVEDSHQPVNHREDEAVNQSSTEGGHNELEPVLYHSVGPNILSQMDAISVCNAHIYEVDDDYRQSEDGQHKSSTSDTSECPSPSEVI